MSDDTERNAGIVEILSPVILTFPNLLVPKPFTRNGKAVGEPKYSGNLEMAQDHPQLAALKARAAAVAKAKFPGVSFKDLVFPFTNGDKLADAAKAKKRDREFSRGKVILAARSKFAPSLSVIVNAQITEFDESNRAVAGRHFYSGAEVLARVNFVAYDGVGEGGKPGVTAYLGMVLATGKGKRLTGGASAAEVFKGYVGTASAEDPVGGSAFSDDEIPT